MAKLLIEYPKIRRKIQDIYEKDKDYCTDDKQDLALTVSLRNMIDDLSANVANRQDTKAILSGLSRQLDLLQKVLWIDVDKKDRYVEYTKMEYTLDDIEDNVEEKYLNNKLMNAVHSWKPSTKED